MNLDLSSFHKAIGSLQRTLQVADDQSFMSGLSDSQKDAIRAGVIQNFEFTYAETLLKALEARND